jgi:hypothetical protein
LSYDNLAISNGEEASLTWFKLQQGEGEYSQKEDILTAMKAYCDQDSYGMVSILNHLMSFKEPG